MYYRKPIACRYLKILTYQMQHRHKKKNIKIDIAELLNDKLEEKQKLLWNNKIQPGKFEDLIGFIKQLMIWAAPHLASRGAHRGVVQNGRFFQKEDGTKKVVSKRKGLFQARPFLGGKKGVFPCKGPHHSLGNEEVPCGRVLLPLTKNSWLTSED